MDILDLAPSARALGQLVLDLTDDELASSTPCPAYTVADLVDHVGGLTVAFTAAARKEPLGSPTDGDPRGDGSRLEVGFRERIAHDLDGLVAAWSDPTAYTGETQAGPVVLPGFVAARVALNELVIHAWDLAVATGHSYDPDPDAVEVCASFVSTFDAPADEAVDDASGLFGPPVAVPDDAPQLDRLLGMVGRDPAWSA